MHVHISVVTLSYGIVKCDSCFCNHSALIRMCLIFSVVFKKIMQIVLGQD